jgi:plastocyanin domain-containing protein
MKFSAVLVPVALAFAGSASADAPAKHDPSRIEISITRSGFDPGNITVPAKTPVTLVFTRKTDATCIKDVMLTLDDGKKIERELPLDKPVELAVTFPKAGKLTYACSMDMVKGVIVVQ